MTHVKRVVTWGFLPKAGLFVATLLLGTRLGATATMVAVLVFAVLFVRRHTKENYWESQADKRQRMIEDMVWDNTRWLNQVNERLETPQEGILRLDKEL
jgi:hypothetical protein